jgi:hypothetical protein
MASRGLARHGPLMVPDAGALTQPDGARPEHASQLARTGRVTAIARPERKVLVIAGEVIRRAARAGMDGSRRAGLRPAGSVASARLASRRERVGEG